MQPPKIRRFTSLHHFSSNNSNSTNYSHISLAETNYWNPKLSGNIQCDKNNHSDCLIFQKLPEYQKKKWISAIFWAFRNKLHIIHATTYIALFLLDSNNCFLYTVYPYLSLLFSHFVIFFFHFLFLTLLATRNILQFTMFRFHYNLPLILRK